MNIRNKSLSQMKWWLYKEKLWLKRTICFWKCDLLRHLPLPQAVKVGSSNWISSSFLSAFFSFLLLLLPMITFVVDQWTDSVRNYTTVTHIASSSILFTLLKSLPDTYQVLELSLYLMRTPRQRDELACPTQKGANDCADTYAYLFPLRYSQHLLLPRESLITTHILSFVVWRPYACQLVVNLQQFTSCVLRLCVIRGSTLILNYTEMKRQANVYFSGTMQCIPEANMNDI